MDENRMTKPIANIWVSRKGHFHVSSYLAELMAMYQEYYWSLMSQPLEQRMAGSMREAEQVSYLVSVLGDALAELDKD